MRCDHRTYLTDSVRSYSKNRHTSKSSNKRSCSTSGSSSYRHKRGSGGPVYRTSSKARSINTRRCGGSSTSGDHRCSNNGDHKNSRKNVLSTAALAGSYKKLDKRTRLRNSRTPLGFGYFNSVHFTTATIKPYRLLKICGFFVGIGCKVGTKRVKKDFFYSFTF